MKYRKNVQYNLEATKGSGTSWLKEKAVALLIFTKLTLPFTRHFVYYAQFQKIMSGPFIARQQSSRPINEVRSNLRVTGLSSWIMSSSTSSSVLSVVVPYGPNSSTCGYCGASGERSLTLFNRVSFGLDALQLSVNVWDKNIWLHLLCLTVKARSIRRWLIEVGEDQVRLAYTYEILLV
jgi:hypothetical protein